MFNSSDGALILDVRSEASFLERRVSVAVNVIYEDITGFAAANIPDKDKTIITYCFCDGKGGPALSARDLLTELGYTSVFYMDPEDEWTYAGTHVPDTDAQGADAQDTDVPEAATGNSGRGKISGSEAKKLFESDEKVIMLDVRGKDEYEENHIVGSTLIPVAQLEERLSELPDKEVIIIVYCRAGRRSEAAYDILVNSGYVNVYDMQSINNWP